MDKDYSELVSYLDGKFTKIDERFSEIDGRLIKIDERFSETDKKLLIVSNRLSNIESILDEKADKEDFNNLLTSIDAYAKKADTYFQEMVMLARKVDRMEKWLHQVADKIGIKLEY